MKKYLDMFLFSLWSTLMVVAGFFVATKLDKPESIVNNTIKKVKTSGNENEIDVTNKPETTVEESKKRFRIFKKKARY